MTNVDMVNTAIQKLGDVSSAELADFVKKTFGVNISPKFIPIYRESIRDKERLEKVRHAAKTATPGTVVD